jgi:hypothetical protein
MVDLAHIRRLVTAWRRSGGSYRGGRQMWRRAASETGWLRRLAHILAGVTDKDGRPDDACARRGSLTAWSFLGMVFSYIGLYTVPCLTGGRRILTISEALSCQSRRGPKMKATRLGAQLRRQLTIIFMAAATCAGMTVLLPGTASAASLYCRGGSLWQQCLYHWTTSTVPPEHIQAQSANLNRPVYGHTELIGLANGSGCPAGHKNSANRELMGGQTQTVTVNINGSSCHLRWCSIFWESDAGGPFYNAAEECANIPT